MELSKLLTKKEKRFACLVLIFVICLFAVAALGKFCNGFTKAVLAEEIAHKTDAVCDEKDGETFNKKQELQDSNFTNLIVFIKFSGESEFINDTCGGSFTVKDIVENSYTKADYCVTDYYQKVSNGKVQMQNLYLYDVDGGSLTLNKERGYYCSNQINNPDGYEYYEYGTRMYELKQDWSAAITSAINNGVKISNVDKTAVYDLKQLDKNGDGYLDSLTLIYKYSDKYSVAWSDCLWNYQDFYSGAIFAKDETLITSGAYLQITANFNYLYSDANGLKFASLKTMIHETGHIFGLKDLYRSQTNSRVYYMSTMANALSPVPQYISSKEREALGWLDQSNIAYIDSAGTYTVNVIASQPARGIVCYKIDVSDTDKTLYLEYRNFAGSKNKYDSQEKEVYNAYGNQISRINLKSGLVCFLADKDTKFPNNLNTSGSHWNYEVLGGQYATKSDAALQGGESLLVSQNLLVEVVAVEDEKLTFRVVGDGIESGNKHSVIKTPYKAAICTDLGNIEYWYCLTCNKYFADELLKKEIEQSDTIINLIPHSGKIIKGEQPTCSSKGFSDGEECEFCGKVIIARQEINKLNHEPSDWIIDKRATALENGQRHKECLKCFEVLVTETIIYQDDSSENVDSGGNIYDDSGVSGGGDSGNEDAKPPINNEPIIDETPTIGNGGNLGDLSSDESGEDEKWQSSGNDYSLNGCKSNFSSSKVLCLTFISTIALFIKKRSAKK